MAQLISVKLSRFDGSPWGFRLQGGKDFGTPLVVQKVNGGSPAEQAGLRAGDAVIKVNNTDTFNLRHKDAQDVIVRGGNSFEMTVQRGGSTWKPSVTPVQATLPSPQPASPAGNIAPVTKTSLAAKKQDAPLIGSGHNFSPKPFLNGNGEAPIKSIVNKQYNTPVGIYSEETIAETLSAQAEVLAGGVLGVNFKKNEKNYNAENSEVFKMVQEADKEPKTPEPAEPTIQSEVISPVSPAIAGLRPVSAPETKPQPTTPQSNLPPGQNICADCERLIVGVFVRIKEKNLHVECFKCSTCGTSLKNVGYYNINNKLYCDIHAKMVARQTAPAGLTPITVPPGSKAPAGTISAALANIGAGAPLSPSLNNHSPQPFSACNRSTANSVQSSLQRLHLENGSYSPRQASCNGISEGKTFTSTLTIQTGNEVGCTDKIKRLSPINNSNPKIGDVCEIVFNTDVDKEPSDDVDDPTYPTYKQSTRFGVGTSPVSPPTLRPVQAPTSNNIGGPKPFGGSTTAPSLISPISNSGSNTLPRPQSQSITGRFSTLPKPKSTPFRETYLEESNYYEVTESRSEIPSSVRSKSLVWPPVKALEDITYPTASPLYINPNPALNERHEQLIQERLRCQESKQEEVDSESLRRGSLELRRQGKEAMEHVSCPGPVYRKVELVNLCTQRETRCREILPRPSSCEGVRRSLTPTRITQPVPQPWTATVTSGTSLFETAYVEEPQICPTCEICQELICQKIETHEEHICTACRLKQIPEPEPPKPKPKIRIRPDPIEEFASLDLYKESEIDLSEIVPQNLAVVPQGVDGQHQLFTETTEKDVGDMHIKKTTIYEKTVELVDPDEETEKPKITEVVEKSNEHERSDEQEIEEYISSESQKTTSKVDVEVAKISRLKNYSESAQVIAKAVDTQKLVEQVKQEEEEKSRAEMATAAKKISSAITSQEIREGYREQQEIEDRRQTLIEQQKTEERRQSFNELINEQESQQVTEQRYQELNEEIEIQESFEKLEEQRRQSLREQVEVHQSLREQQIPERRQCQQSLQERRLSAKFSQPQQQPPAVVENVCVKKHVQFVTKTDAGVQPLPPTMIKNATPREWQSEMVKALTTAPPRPYSPFVASAIDEERVAGQIYSAEVVYDQITQARSTSPFVQALTIAPSDRYCRTCPAVSHEKVTLPEVKEPYYPRGQEPGRPVSPFRDALTTAPERPFTPLAQQEPVCCCRSQTQIAQAQPEIECYCHPAEILYSDTRTQESIRQERSLSRKSMTPQPLPTPPPNYRLRDSSKSPTRSRSQTPSNRSLMTGIKKPDLIPSYQRNLVAMQVGPVESQPYIPSRSPTPAFGASKSPAMGPPEPPAIFLKAQAPKVRVEQYRPPPEQEQTVSYHHEEDTPTGHVMEDYTGKKTVCYAENKGTYSEGGQQVSKDEHLTRRQRQQHLESQDVSTEDTVDEHGMIQHVKKTKQISEEFEQTQKKAVIEIKKSFDANTLTCSKQSQIQPESDPKPGCLISQFSRSQATIACPMGQAHSDKFPKTGVCVLPPCPKAIGPDRSQSCQKSAFCGTQSQICQKISQSQPSAFSATRPKTCPETGVTVLPCKALSDSGSKAGVVVVPCEGTMPGPKSGICIVPNADRTGVCVSPCFGPGMTQCGQPSGNYNRSSGSAALDLGTCAKSGICVTPCNDGSGAVLVAPCSIPGTSSVQCTKTISRTQCTKVCSPRPANLPFPQIPLPDEEEPVCNPYPQIPTPVPSDSGFQPIHKPRTNLGCQLTQLVQQTNKRVIQVYKPQAQCQTQNQCPLLAPIGMTQNLVDPPNLSSHPDLGSGVGGFGAGPKSGSFAGSSAPKRGRGILNQQSGPGSRVPLCGHCNSYVRGPFITALGQIWCPDHFVCVNTQCRRQLQDIGFVEEKGQLYCEYCFEQYIAPGCNKCNNKIKGDCLNAIGKHFHPECFNCSYCGKLFGNNPFFLEEGLPYCEADWNELFTTKCFACGFPVEAGDRWVEALNNNYHSQCFNCTMCKKNLEGQSFYAKGGRPFCKNHAR